MLISMLIFVCVALNTCLIGFYLLRPLIDGLSDLALGFKRSRRYFHSHLTETREKALRQRTLLLIGRLTVVVTYLATIALAYSPSMIFAHYQSSLSDAFFSAEALAGFAAAVVVGLGIRKSSRKI
jgi:hypothetical protein